MDASELGLELHFFSARVTAMTRMEIIVAVETIVPVLLIHCCVHGDNNSMFFHNLYS